MSQSDDVADWVRADGSILIRRPPNIVFQFIRDPRNDGQWMGNIDNAQKLSCGPIGLGSRFRQSAIFLGAPVFGEWEVSDYVENVTFNRRSVAGPFTFLIEHHCEAEEPGSRLTKSVHVRMTRALVVLTRGAATSLLTDAIGRALARLKLVLDPQSNQTS